ncbi:MAG: hypothetical protein ACMXX6_00935 [Candidatus Woesearchaeota archaeon]
MEKIQNIIIGSKNYPNIKSSLLSNNKRFNINKVKNRKYDDVKKYLSKFKNLNFNFEEKTNNDRKENIKLLGLTNKSTDVEVKKLGLGLNYNAYYPTSKAYNLSDFKITSNIKIPKYVEKIVNDELKANKALKMLYNKGFDSHYLSQIFSTSNLGIKSNRKFVPTKWSITSIDDSLSKYNTENLQREISDFMFFEGKYLKNRYFIFILPGKFEFEFFEILLKDKKIISDFESIFGRKKYAFKTAGGYYAAKFAVSEYLKTNKKHGKVVVLRFIEPDYTSLGVWVVRQGVKESFKHKKSFNSLKEMLVYTKIYKEEHISLYFAEVLAKSKLLNNYKKQTLLSQYT